MKLLGQLLLLLLLIGFTTSLSAQTQPEVFNVSVYEGIYVDIMNAYGSNLAGATNHWTNQGLPVEGRRASIIFDPVYYLNHNSDLKAAFGEHGYAAAAQHFITQGLPIEGRRGSLEFDVKYYIANNSGVPATYLDAADDFINSGLPFYGRRGSADFSVIDYMTNYPDVGAAYGPGGYQNAALHWLRRGKGLGRHGFGLLAPPTECGGNSTTEYVTVPLPSPSPTPTPATVTLQIAHPTPLFADLGVIYVNPPTGFSAQLQNIGSGTPQRGQFTAVNGTYTFSSADAEAPLQITYKLDPITPDYSRIFFATRPPFSGSGTGKALDPFDPSVMDDKLRFISEQTPGHVPPNVENGNGAPYPQTKLIVCLGAPDSVQVFPTLGNYDWLIGQNHTLGNPDSTNPPTPAGFTVNRDWHIHGAGMNNTTLRLNGVVRSRLSGDPRGFPSNTAFGLMFGTFDDNSSGVEISDLTIDLNYASLKQSNPMPLNMLAINLRSHLGGHNIHNVNVLGFAGEIASPLPANIRFEAFPVSIVANFPGAGTNASPLRSNNNQIKYVLMSGMPPTPGACTAINLANVQAEVAYNIANSWAGTGYGACNGFGGFQMDSSWFHDNFAFNNAPDGYITDSDVNRNITVEFNTISNPQSAGIAVGGGNVYDYFLLQWNTITLGQNNTLGIKFQGNVIGATVKNNNIVTPGSLSGAGGIAFAGANNGGSIFEFNQISSRLSNSVVPGTNCVFNNWNESGVQLSNFPNTQSSPCAAPAQPYATMQTDGNFVVYGAGNVPIFNTQTNGTGGVIIKMQDDGNLVVYAEVWQAGTYATPSPGPFPPQTCTIGNALFAPQTLPSGKCILSTSGQYLLYMSPDGNFYIYDIAHNIGTWGANTQGNPGATATLQLDGNFVVYTTNQVALWSSGTFGSGADFLEMENDGRIILYRPVWSSGTLPGAPLHPIPPTRPSCDIGTGTGWTGVIGAGQCFVSPNGRFEMLLLADGALEIIDRTVDPAQADPVIWLR